MLRLLFKTRVIILIIVLLFLSDVKAEDWNSVCRHESVYAAYMVKSSDNPLPIRFAVGLIYDKKWKNPEWHTRAQVYDKETKKWQWLCVGYDLINKNNFAYTCDRPDTNFAVKHYVSLIDAINDKWKTYKLED